MANTTRTARISNTSDVTVWTTDCGSHTAVTMLVTFVWGGRMMQAVRFERSDTGCRGVEIYFGIDGRTHQVEFARYAREVGGTQLDRLALESIRRGERALAVAAADVPTDSAERYALIELH